MAAGGKPPAGNTAGGKPPAGKGRAAADSASAIPRPAKGWFRPAPPPLKAHGTPVTRDTTAAADPSQPLLGRRRGGAAGKPVGKPSGAGAGATRRGPGDGGTPSGGKPGRKPPRGR
jgi:hypothetical protein